MSPLKLMPGFGIASQSSFTDEPIVILRIDSPAGRQYYRLANKEATELGKDLIEKSWQPMAERELQVSDEHLK